MKDAYSLDRDEAVGVLHGFFLQTRTIYRKDTARMGRRDAGMGSVYQRKDGLWVAQHKGQYRYAKSEQEAKRKLRQLLQQGDTVKPSTITVGIALDQYLDYAKQELKPRTVERYTIAAESHLRPAFGSTKLHKLTAMQVETTYRRMLRDGLAASTIQLMHAILSSTVKRCVRLQLVQTNVCRDVRCPRIKREEVQVFDPSEVHRLLSAAKYDRLEALWVLALTTGARQAELMGLQVRDYDKAKGTLAIRRSVWKGQTGSTKSSQGNRVIALPSRARTALDTHIEKHAPQTWLFPTRSGKPFTASHLIVYCWKPLLKRADVPYRTMHTARHTVASTLLGKGLAIPAIARYLGHTPQTLLRTYAHCLPNQMDAVAAALDAALG
jgi:integrase